MRRIEAISSRLNLSILPTLLFCSSIAAQDVKKPQHPPSLEPVILRNIANIKPPIKAELWAETRCGATGVVTKDSVGQYLVFWLHRDYASNGWKVQNVSVGEFDVDKDKPPNGLNFRRDISIGGEEENLLLKMLKQWRDTDVPVVKRRRLSRILSLRGAAQDKEASRLSDDERSLLSVFLVIQDLESR
jgi:hypothetical protein